MKTCRQYLLLTTLLFIVDEKVHKSVEELESWHANQFLLKAHLTNRNEYEN